MVRVKTGAIGLLMSGWATVLATAAGMAGDSASFTDIAVEVCPEIVLRGDKLPELLSKFGFEQSQSGAGSPRWLMRTYMVRSPRGTTIVLTSTIRRYADATQLSCQLLMTGEDPTFDIATVRRRLEAIPGIGRLDGDVAVDLGTLLSKSNEGAGSFKRPGNDPLIFVNITKALRATFFNMSRTDLELIP